MQGHWRGHLHAPQMHPVRQTVDLMLQCAAREVQTHLNHRRPKCQETCLHFAVVWKTWPGCLVADLQWPKCVEYSGDHQALEHVGRQYRSPSPVTR